MKSVGNTHAFCYTNVVSFDIIKKGGNPNESRRILYPYQ